VAHAFDRKGSRRSICDPGEGFQRYVPDDVSQDDHGKLSRRSCQCAAACPANCIYIEAGENTDTQRISAGERYASVYNIDYSRCIFCGYCVEACPTDAITHGHSIDLAPYDINAMIYRKEQLLEPWPPRTSPAR
jgi:NADH-quinone oxidoreductase subunit I